MAFGATSKRAGGTIAPQILQFSVIFASFLPCETRHHFCRVPDPRMSLEKPAGLQVFYGLIERDLYRKCDSKPISAAGVPELTLNSHG